MATIVALGTVLVNVSSAAAAPDLSGAISAARRSQIATEGAMRTADKRIKAFKRDTRTSRRKLQRAERKLDRQIGREADLKTKLARAENELNQALGDGLSPYLAPEIVNPVPPPQDGAATETTVLAGTVVIDGLAAIQPVDAESAPPVVRVPATLAEISSLKRTMKKHKLAYRKSTAKTRRAHKTRRAKARHIRTIHKLKRATIYQRERSERSLGATIKSMTRLSKTRAKERFKARPGVGRSRFMRPSNGRISQGYHSGHDGLDIVSYSGAPIRAAAAGVVAYVGWNPWDKGRRAFVVVVGHATGYETIYGHLLPIRRVRIGQGVLKGQIIGRMGSTGHSTGTHVHFEVSRNWRTLNPAYVL
jgi:murein DD-endopeptidase MepM/ murein hydrolase activator NlpD